MQFSHVLAALALALPVSAQNWSELQTSTWGGSTGLGGPFIQARNLQAPSERHSHALVPYPGSQTGELLLFGGRAANVSGAPYFNDSWRWNGLFWQRLQLGGGPSVRESPTACYDPLRDEIVLTSGWNGGVYLQDTWTFDGTSWSNQPTGGTHPPGRDWSAMAFDPNSGTCILFGGHIWQNVVAGLGQEGDTWSWDGTQWTQLAPANSPPARSMHAMAWDGNLGMLILIGGNHTVSNGADMWGWNGSDWVDLSATTPVLPPATVWGSMVWDATRGVVVYHGGAPGTGSTPASNETWEWNGVTWYQASSAGPARCASPMAYNPVFLRTEMVGGALLANRQQTTDGNWIYGF